MRGKFIVLEGGEGAGKSSALSWLKSEFPAGKFMFTREPGGSVNAEEIRNTIVANRPDELDVLTHLLLFEAARREHVLKTIRPALASGTNIICDRFSPSTYAYQVVAGKGVRYKDFFLEADALVCGDTVPDFIVFLDVDPKVGIARKRCSGEHLNVFDEKNIAFHEKVRTGMKEYCTGKPHVVIDAHPSQEEVREEVKRVILKYLEEYHAG
ncbi:MAG: dTMP kinase [Candidatus Paceibacteria bacterium]